MDTLNDPQLSSEERQLLLNNLHTEIRGREYRLCVNRHCGPAMERILQLSNDGQVKRFFNALKTRLYNLFTDRIASHAMQQMLFRLPEIMIHEHDSGEPIPFAKVDDFADDDEEDGTKAKKAKGGNGEEEEEEGNHSDEHEGDSIERADTEAALTAVQEEEDAVKHGTPFMQDLFLEACESLTPHWMKLVEHAQGSYIMRTILLILGGRVGLTKEMVQQSGQESNTNTGAQSANTKGKFYNKYNAEAKTQEKDGFLLPEDEYKSKQQQEQQQRVEKLRLKMVGESRAHLKRLRTVLPRVVKAVSSSSSEKIQELCNSVTAVPVLRALLYTVKERQRKKEHIMTLATLIGTLMLWKAEKKDKKEKRDGDDDDEDKPDYYIDKGGIDEDDNKEEEEVEWRLGKGSMNHVQSLFTSSVGSRLMEAVLETAAPDMFETLFYRHILPNMVDYAMERTANHCLQRALSVIDNGKMLRQCVDTLLFPRDESTGDKGGAAQLIQCNRAGVLWKLTEAAARVQDDASQMKVTLEVIKACGCSGKVVERLIEDVKNDEEAEEEGEGEGEEEEKGDEGGDEDGEMKTKKKSKGKGKGKRKWKEEHVTQAGRDGMRPLVPRLLTLRFTETVPKEGDPLYSGYIVLMGSLIAQSMLKFLPRSLHVLMASIASLECDAILWLLKEAAGARFLEAVLLSNGITLKEKRRLIRRLEGRYAKAVMSAPAAGYFVEKAFFESDLEGRTLIAKDLLQNERKILASRGGVSLWEKVKMATYKESMKVYEGEMKTESNKGSGSGSEGKPGQNKSGKDGRTKGKEERNGKQDNVRGKSEAESKAGEQQGKQEKIDKVRAMFEDILGTKEDEGKKKNRDLTGKKRTASAMEEDEGETSETNGAKRHKRGG